MKRLSIACVCSSNHFHNDFLLILLKNTFPIIDLSLDLELGQEQEWVKTPRLNIDQELGPCPDLEFNMFVLKILFMSYILFISLRNAFPILDLDQDTDQNRE